MKAGTCQKYRFFRRHWAGRNGTDKKISNEFSDKLVHKWRSEESAIMVGTRTAESDDPMLTVRNWKGNNPLRIVIDRKLRLPKSLNLFNKSASTIIFNERKNEIAKNVEYVAIEFDSEMADSILSTLYKRKILSVMVEGGANLLNQFIAKNLWDEARIITSTSKFFEDGMRSPVLNGKLQFVSDVTGDSISVFYSFNSIMVEYLKKVD